MIHKMVFISVLSSVRQVVGLLLSFVSLRLLKILIHEEIYFLKLKNINRNTSNIVPT